MTKGIFIRVPFLNPAIDLYPLPIAIDWRMPGMELLSAVKPAHKVCDGNRPRRKTD